MQEFKELVEGGFRGRCMVQVIRTVVIGIVAVLALSVASEGFSVSVEVGGIENAESR